MHTKNIESFRCRRSEDGSEMRILLATTAMALKMNLANVSEGSKTWKNESKLKGSGDEMLLVGMKVVRLMLGDTSSSLFNNASSLAKSTVSKITVTLDNQRFKDTQQFCNTDSNQIFVPMKYVSLHLRRKLLT